MPSPNRPPRADAIYVVRLVDRTLHRRAVSLFRMHHRRAVALFRMHHRQADAWSRMKFSS